MDEWLKPATCACPGAPKHRRSRKEPEEVDTSIHDHQYFDIEIPFRPVRSGGALMLTAQSSQHEPVPEWQASPHGPPPGPQGIPRVLSARVIARQFLREEVMRYLGEQASDLDFTAYEQKDGSHEDRPEAGEGRQAQLDESALSGSEANERTDLSVAEVQGLGSGSMLVPGIVSVHGGARRECPPNSLYRISSASLSG